VPGRGGHREQALGDAGADAFDAAAAVEFEASWPFKVSSTNSMSCRSV
jgi:hypothetical protein